MKLMPATYRQADFENNANFSGCDDRLGVWWFILVNFLLSTLISIVTPALSVPCLRYPRPWS